MRNSLKNAITLIAICPLFTVAGSAFAHDGHGQHGAHWHATDAWGFVALGMCLALALWLSRGGK